MTAGYPFSAVVGHDDLRLALLLNAVHPAIGGVLVRGEKGTAKSTVVRGLAALLPAVQVVEGCRFSCDPAAPDPACPDAAPHSHASPPHTATALPGSTPRDLAPTDPAASPLRAAVSPPTSSATSSSDLASADPATSPADSAPTRAAPSPRQAATALSGSTSTTSAPQPSLLHSGAATRPARLVELPVGATEDRLVGSLDLERALTEGVRAYQPGLLCAAHRGVLYVDEVNLLHDHLVDLLLDAAAMGRAHVEREGVSVSHAASFLLVGTMNPEEGELRPQLLDRFGLTVEVVADRDVNARTEVIRRRLAFENDPAGFAAGWAEADRALAERIVAAKAALPSVLLPDTELRRIAALCASFGVDGMRADLVVARTAVAHAAWRGGDAVEEQDVEAAARLALPHRRRRDPFDEPGLDEEQLQQALRDAADSAEPPPDDDPDGPDSPGGEPPPVESTVDGNGSGGQSQPAAVPDPAFRARLLSVDGIGEGAPGRRSRARAGFGRTLRATQSGGHGVHLVGTLTAAAPHQAARGRDGAGIVLRRTDIRHAVREGRESNLVLFAVDASGSMAARKRMSAVTGAVVSLLLDAYQRRDKVGLVTFRGAAAELVLPPTSSVEAAVARLRRLGTGGRTPLADGLLRAHRTLTTERLRDPRRRPLLVVVTDGRATVPLRADPVEDSLRVAGLLAADGVASVVVDCERGPVRLGLPARLAAALGGTCVRLDELSSDVVTGVVRAARSAA